MDDKELKIERWSVCNRYKNYKSTNYYKEPLQFRPHPANVVRDVIMYHIYHNEGQLCNDALVQYIKSKIIDDLNVIFMLYEYAPDAISTINRLMSSKRHIDSEITYNEMMFHALTIRDARDILIEQITNVLIKCIPEPLGNIKFDTIMKDEIMNNNTKESSIEENIRNEREVRIETRKKEFLNCKSETEKVMLFPRHDLVKLAVEDIITDTVEKYQNEFELMFKEWRKGEMKHISKETIISSHIFSAMGTITQTFIVSADVDKRIEDSIEYILNDSLNDPTRENGIKHITNNIWYSFYDAYFKNVLAFPKPVEDSSTDEADKQFDFSVKSVSAKLYNHVYNIVDDLINKSCDHVEDMMITTRTFAMFPEIGYDEYKVLILTGTIGYHLSVTLDIDMKLAHEEAYEAIVNKFKFKHCLDPKSNKEFMYHMAGFVCRNLSFDKSMELEKEASQHEQKEQEDMKQEETKTPKMKLRYLFRAWSGVYKPQPFIVKSVDKDEKYFEQTENVDGITGTTRSHCLEVYIHNHLHKIFLTTFVWKKADDYDDEMVTSFLEFVRVRGIPVQLTLTECDGFTNLHIETEDGNLWVDENCDDVMIESRTSTTHDVLYSGIEDEIRFNIADSKTRNTIECVTYMYTNIFEEQKKRPVISINIADGTVILSNFWISEVLEQVSQYNECAYRFDRYEKIISVDTEEGTKKYKFKEFIDEVVEPIVCKYLKTRYIRDCNTHQTNNTKECE